MNGVALLECEIPPELVERFRLRKRLYSRGPGIQEFRFLWLDAVRLLPIWYEGEFQIVPWGNIDRRCALPQTGWTWKQSLEEGRWGNCQPEGVRILANLALANGVWYPVRQGIQGILVRDQNQVPHVYVVCKEPSRYYRVMTRTDRQPILIEEDI